MNKDEYLRELDDVPNDDDEKELSPEAPCLQVQMLRDETLDQANARAALTPEYHACGSIWQLNRITAFKTADLTELAERLDGQVSLLKDGDLGQAESMLAAQAYTLDALFHNLLHRSALNARNEFGVVEKLMKLALKAQSQCRTTLDSLASVKRPPELIKQTNIAHGHQQVNNFPEKGNRPNELLENTDGMDPGTSAEAVRGDQTLETVAAKHRSKDK